MFVLDTNIISELRQGKTNPSLEVRAWASRHPAAQLYLSVISVLELERGVMLLERRSPPQGGAHRVWLDGLRQSFSRRILPFNDRTATLCAAMHVPNPRSDRDAMIAATALEHGFGVATRNVSDFRGTGVVIVNPFDESDH